MAESLQGDEDGDINDAFDSIVMLEQKVAAVGFREGYEKGQQEGTKEGYRLGLRHGLIIGSELGLYRGTASTWLDVAIETKFKELVPEKTVAALQKVIELLDKFPDVTSAEVDVNSEMNKVRAAYRKACSLLRVETSIPVPATISF